MDLCIQVNERGKYRNCRTRTGDKMWDVSETHENPEEEEGRVEITLMNIVHKVHQFTSKF